MSVGGKKRLALINGGRRTPQVILELRNPLLISILKSSKSLLPGGIPRQRVPSNRLSPAGVQRKLVFLPRSLAPIGACGTLTPYPCFSALSLGLTFDADMEDFVDSGTKESGSACRASRVSSGVRSLAFRSRLTGEGIFPVAVDLFATHKGNDVAEATTMKTFGRLRRKAVQNTVIEWCTDVSFRVKRRRVRCDEAPVVRKNTHCATRIAIQRVSHCLMSAAAGNCSHLRNSSPTTSTRNRWDAALTG